MDVQSFDFLSVLDGRGYPTKTVKINLAEDVAYTVKQLREKYSKATVSTPEEKEAFVQIEKDLDEAEALLKKSELTFKIRGLSQDHLKSLFEEYKLKFPDTEQTMNGIKFPVPHKDFEWWYKLAEEHAHIVEVTNHEGAVSKVTYEDYVQFAGKAPDSQYQKLVEAIDSLNVEARFFEASVDENF